MDQVPYPELPIVDAHHHLYQHNHWAADNGPFLIQEFAAAINTGHNVRSTVYVECGEFMRQSDPEHLRGVGEVEHIASVARLAATGTHGPARMCEAIVGHADLMLGDAVEEVLDALTSVSDGRLRSIRFATTWDADRLIMAGSRPFGPRHLMAEPKFREGIARLVRHGLAYDAWQLYPQLGELADVARAHPDAVIVAGHCGGLVGRRGYANPENFANWKARILELAQCPNVLMKLGGLANDRTGFGFQGREGDIPEAELIATWSPYILTCIEAFGADRCMFESNFPVDRCATDYRTLWTVFKKIAAGASDHEMRALFAGTAQRAYRLGEV